eukprot:TRINITY_DN2143_c0_g1_i1.p1 TRINITY_DN2143_c0_g1~~TRINITY_DN2143_c0_g1_i1.p1  ORF type:complete len:437 (-),score=88.24 TRINITY_DN2143_c0_g1_i1:84-1367(-)
MSTSLSLLLLLTIFAVAQAALQIPLHGKNSLYENDLKIRGVNLGGWLVLEPWITPSLFKQFEGLPPDQQAVDEWTFCDLLPDAESQLQQHWATWVTYDELKTLADSDITHLRIPVGYWILSIDPSEPWVSGGWPYLVNVVDWAGSLGLKVIIDLHGAPGSQNGFDNSGRRGGVYWAYNQTFINRTVDVIKQIADFFDTPQYRDVVVGIELVNEPRWDIPLNIVQDYYFSGYNAIRTSPQDSMWDMSVVIHDSFRFYDWWGFMQPPNYQNVILDTHIYSVFDENLLTKSYDQHLDWACSFKDSIRNSNYNLWTVVGEWCIAVTDCTQWLNGFGVGARYDGTMDGYPYIGSCVGDTDINNSTTFNPEYKAFLNEFFEYSHDAFSAGSGWFFWNFKAEASPQWSYLDGLAQGWIPKDLDSITRSCDSRKK